MASWTGDGKVRGYVSGPNTLADAFLLTYPAVDLGNNGVTRLRASNSANPYTYPLSTLGPFAQFNRVFVSAVPLSFTSGDVTSVAAAYPTITDFKMGATLWVCEASRFGTGVTPTPWDIMNEGTGIAFDSETTRATAGALTTYIYGPRPGPDSPIQFAPNTKYWIMVLPTWSGKTPKLGVIPARNYQRKPFTNTEAWVNANGRAITLWSDRSPKAPDIALSSGVFPVNAGVTVNLTMVPHDPDQTGTDTTQKLDLAGVEVQYAAVPTASDPSPTWLPLPFAYKTGWPAPGTDPGWFITQNSQSDASRDGVAALWSTRTVAIRCGATSSGDGKGVLPAGQWQIRVRTFSFGHPFPEHPDVAPLGFPPGTSRTPATYWPECTSPWSTPVSITVLSQVPPPLLVSPVGGTAISEGSAATLVWKYRNQALPPFPQKSRLVQIRKVGEAAWTNLATLAELSSAASFEIPYNPPPSSAFSFHDDSTSTAGWSTSSAYTVVGPSTDYALYASIGKTQNIPDAGSLSMSRTVAGVPSAGKKSITLKGWRASPDPTSAPVIVESTFTLAGVAVAATRISQIGTLRTGSGTDAITGWEAVYEVADGLVFDKITTKLITGARTIPQEAFLGFTGIWVEAQQVNYALQATTEYEWRVQVQDTDTPSAVSNFSQVGRFWVVPAPGTGPVAPNPELGVAAGTLGCGTHRVEIFRRGGTERVGELGSISSLEWNRVRDDISTARVVVSNWDEDCGTILTDLQTWAYEIVITRDNGYSSDRVWEGPITLLAYEADTVTINAKDVMGYAYRRIIKQTMNDTRGGTGGQPVTSRALQILQNVFAPDDPNVLAYLQMVPNPDDRMQYRNAPAFSRTAFEEIDDMAANFGLDYTAIGRSIIVWGTRSPIGRLPEFRDEDLGSSPIVSEYGMSMANVYSVADGNGLYGVAVAPSSGLTEVGGVVSGNDPIYGLVEMLSSSWASDTADEVGTVVDTAAVSASFEGYAATSIETRYPPPVIVRIPDNTTLNPSTPLSIQSLVPGVAVPIRSESTLRKVSATQKLDSMKVVEVDRQETITVTLSPFKRGDLESEGAEEGGDA